MERKGEHIEEMFRKLIRLIALVTSMLLPLHGFSQGISTFSSVNPANLVVCGSAQTFTFKISNSSLSDSIKNGKATVRLPIGFQYVSGSVSSTPSGVKESNISNLNQVVFSIPLVTPKDSVKFSISVSVNCSVISYINGGGSLRNFISLSYNGTAIDSGYTSYFSVGIPSLSVSQFTNQSYSGNVGDTFSRQITITNTAAAPLSSFTVYIIKGNGLVLKSIGTKTYSTSHDTIFVTYNSTDFKNTGNKDGNLDQGEKIVLTETDSVISCNGVGNSYIAGWGCNNTICQKYTTTSNVVISSNAPNLGVSVSSSQNDCYVITSPNLQSVTITNSGSGSAANVLVDIMQSATIGTGYDNGFYTKIDVSSIKIQYGTGPFSTVIPDSTFANYAYSCLGANPKGRFWIKVPIIKAGGKITIEWNVYSCCITQGYLNSWGYVVSYTDQCGSTNYSTSGMGHSYNSNYQLYGTPVVNTNSLIAGDTVSVYLEDNTTYSILLPGTGSPYLQYQFFIYSGIKLVTSSIYLTDATGSITWKPDSIKLVGGIYHVTFAMPPPSGFSFYNSRLVMGLIGDTSTISCNDTADMSYNIYYEPNPACGCKPLLASGIIPFKINCPNPDNVGLNNAKFSFLRTSYGLPDNNDDGFPDPTGSLNFSKIRLDRAMYGDTITASLSGKVLSDAKYPSWRYAFADMKFTTDYLTQLDIKLIIKDSTNKKTYTITNVPYTKSGANYFYYYGTDTLQWVGSSVPSNYVYKEGDSVYITIRYKITKNTQDVNYITLNDDFYFSTVSNPTTSFQHYSINKTPAYYYAVGYFFEACCSDDDNAYGCSGAAFSENYYLSIGNCCTNFYGGDIFPYEYRYWASFTKMKVVIPDNFKYESATLYYYPTQGQGKYGVYYGYPIASAISGDTVFFDFHSFYNPVSGFFQLSDDGFAATLIVYCQPTSNAVSTSSIPVKYYGYFDQSAFLGGGLSPAYTDVDYVNYAAPSITLQPALPTVSTQSDTASWTLYITNKSTSSSVNKPWLAFQNASGKLIVDTVLNGSTLVLDSNGIYHLPALGAGKTFTEKIKAVIKNCVKDSIKVIFGWDCSNFPDSLAAVKYQTQNFYLYANPLLSGLQVKSVNPPDSLYLCDTATYSIFVSNTQSGFATDANLEINLPPGAQLVKGSSKLRYPMKGTLKPVSEPDSLNPYLFVYKSANLSSYLKTNGLAGNYDTTKNEYQIQFKAVTNCAYISGSNLSYTALGYDACGNVASIAGLQEQPLSIIGARSPYSGVLSIGGQTSLSGCGGVSTIKLKFINNGPVATDTSDYMFIDFPNGVNYMSESIKPVHNSPSDSNLIIEALGTSMRYSWKIPAGIKSGDSIVYSISYASNGILNCETFPVILQSATTLSLSCITKHTLCNLKVLTGLASKNFTLAKPSIGISGFLATSIPNPPTSEKLTIKATLTNSGDTLKANSRSVLKFYYDADGNKTYSSGDILIGTDTINALIKPNATYLENKTLIVPSGKACGIIAFWDTAKLNCACAPAEAFYGPVPFQNAGNDTFLCSGSIAKLGADSISGYSYTWSPASGLTNSRSAKTTVTVTNPGLTLLANKYVLTTNRIGCTTSDSVLVNIDPALKISAGSPKTICMGTSISIGSSTAASGGSGTYTYNWSPVIGLSSSIVANPFANPNSTILYKLLVTDTKGCSGKDSVTITVLPVPIVKAGPDVSICAGDSVQIGGSPSASGSPGPYSYAWKPSTGMNKSNVANPKTSPSATTVYVLFATDVNSCHNSDTVNVVVNPLPKLNAGANSTICHGDSAILGGSPTATGSKGPYKYRWTPSSGLSDSLAANPRSAPSSNTNYTLKVIDSNGCVNTAMVSISLNPKLNVSAGPGFRICPGSKAILGGSPTVSGGKPAYQYSWSPSINLNSTSTSNPTANPVMPTAYTLVVTDANNCQASGIEKVFVDTTPPASDTIIDVTTNSWGQIQVNFKQDDSADTKSFNIYRGDSSGSNFTLIGKVAYVKGKTSYLFEDNSVKASRTRYLYKISVSDTCGNVNSYSPVHSPVLLKGFPSDYGAHLYWSKYIGFNVKNYTVQLLKSGAWTNLSGLLPSNDTTYDDTLIPCNTVRYYRIKMTENGGTNAISYSDSMPLIPFDTIRPLPPAIIFITVPSNGKVQVNWTKSSSNDVENYTIYRESGGVFKALDSVGNVNTYTDNTANTLISNCYEVVAVDSCARNRSRISTPHCTVSLQVSNNGCEPANYLTWNAYSGWTGISKYEIYRSINGGSQVLLATTSSATTYKDTGLNFHNNYCYVIKAYQNDGANISFSNTFCKSVYFIDTPQVVVVTKLNSSPTAGEVKVQWISQKSIPHLAFYRLYYSYNKAPYKLLKDSIPIAQDTFIHTGLNTKVGDHYYYLQTMDSCGILSEISAINKTMDFTFHVGQLTHQLNWTPYLGWPVKYYIVQHAINRNPLVDEDTLPGTDTSLHKFPAPCNTRIVYRVKAVSYKGAVSYSDSMGGQAIDSIPTNAPTLENVSYLSGNLVRLDFLGSDSLDTYGYVIKRSENGALFVTAGFVYYKSPHAPAVFVDTVAKQTPLSYQIIAEDSCLNLTNSQIFKTIYLKGLPENLSDSLKWTNFVGYGINKYEVMIYKNSAWQNLVNTIKDTTLFQDSLSCDIPRYYKIEGFGNAGYNTFSDSVSVIPFDTIRPASPVINYVTVLSPTSVSLSWQFSASNKVKNYEIDYKASSSSTWRVFKTVAKLNSIIVTGLKTHDTAYDFRVVAIDTCAGNRSLSGDFHQTVLLKGTPGNLVSLLSWSPYQGFNANRYVIFKWVNNKWTRYDSVSGATTFFNDSTIICHGIYNYKILAYSNNSGFTSYSDSISVQPIDTNTPPTPSIQYASVVSNISIAISWNKSVLGVKQYNLWYKSAHGPWINYAPFFNTYSVTMTNLDTRDSIYSFRINVIDSCSSRSGLFSSVHTVMSIGGTKGNLSNTITWTPYTGFAIRKYFIYTWNNGWHLIDSVSNTTTKYVHQPIPCNTPVNYKIGAIDITGKYISMSDSIQLIPFDTIKPGPAILYSATVLTNNSVQVNWHLDLSTRDKTFEIWRSVNNAKAVKIGTVILDSIFVDNNVNPKTNKNAYYIIAIDSCSNLNRSVPSVTDTLMRISYKTGGCKAYISITWTPYYSLLGGTDSFRIYKSESNSSYSYLATVPGYQLQYTDSLVDAVNHFGYKVQAFNHSQPYYSFTDSIGTTPWIYPRAKAPDLIYNTIVKTSPTKGIIHLKWSTYPFATDTFARGYDLYGANSLNGPFRLLYHAADKSATDFTVNNLNTSDSLNYFYLKVYNSCGLDGTSSIVNSPIKLSLQNKNLEVDLSWKAYQTSDSIKAYKIYRSVDHSYFTLYQVIGSSQLSFRDTNVFCGHLYYYRISALTNNNSLPESFSDSAGIISFDTIKPAAPKIDQVSTNATGQSNGSVLIKFNGNQKASRAGYIIYYSTDGIQYFPGDSFRDLKSDSLIWQQSGLNTAGKPYSFYLTAFDSCGNASSSSDTQAVVYINAIAKDHRDSLHWTSYVGWNNLHYILERKTAGTTWMTIAYPDSSQNNFVDHFTKCDTFYIYRIITVNNGNNLTSLSNEAGTTAFDTSAPIPPQISYVSVVITSKKHGRIDINWARSKSIDVAFYNLYRQADLTSPWVAIATRLTDTMYVDSILDTYRNSYSYRVEAADSCSSPNTSRSKVNTSISLTTQPGDQKIILNWNAYTGWQPAGYIVIRNGVPIGRVGGAITSFTDSTVMCPDTYFYIITAINPYDTNLYAVSSIDSAKPYDNIAPQTPYLIRATVTQPNNTVNLQWTKSRDFDVKGYRIMRQEPQMNYFALIDSILDPNDTVYTDIVNSISDSLCYKVEAFDHCGNSSILSNPGCIIIVQGQSKSLANVLKWNPYQQWPGGVSYYNLYRKINDSVGYELLYQFSNPEFIYSDTGFIADGKDYCYRIEAIENGGFQSNSWSTELCLVQQPLVWIPDAFSPDITIGINDLFGPKGLFIARYEMDVYNRWGSRVYYTNDSKPWDGNYQGKTVGEGVYLYHITIYGHDGKRYYFTGTVEVVN